MSNLKDKIAAIVASAMLVGFLMIPSDAENKSKTSFKIVNKSYKVVSKVDSTKVSHRPKTNKTYKRFYSVWATKYNPTVEQCDSDPFTTADMSKINMRKLNSHQLKWIAISRDLLNQFKLGDIVEIQCSNDKLNGEWEIHDLMNSRFKNKIDFLVPENDHYDMDKPIIVNIRKVIYNS